MSERVDAPNPVPTPDGLRSAIPRWASTLGAILGGIVALVVGGIVSAVIAVGILTSEGGNPLDQAQLEEVVTRYPMVLMSVLFTGLSLTAAALLSAKLTRTSIREGLGFRGAPWPVFILAPLAIIALGPTSDVLVRTMAHLAPDWTFGALDTLQRIAEGNSFWMLWPVIALTPGFAEEIFFRGLVQRSWGFGMKAITISAVSFSFFHMDPHHIVGVLPLGFYLAWLGARTGSLWVCVVTHTFNNSFALLGSKLDVESLNVGHGTDTPMPLWWMFVGWAIAAPLIYGIWRLTRDRRRWEGPAGGHQPSQENIGEVFE
ncbi:MAG: lysostaphin resistance A-like protein [Polyangiales bacterium]